MIKTDGAIERDPNNKAYYRYFSPFHFTISATSQTFTVARVYLAQIEIKEDCVIDQISYQVGAASNGNVRVGVYKSVTLNTCFGGDLLWDSGTVVQGAINQPQVFSCDPLKLVKGIYYIALEGSDATGTYIRQANVNVQTGWMQYYDIGGGFGAFTDPCPAITEGGSYCPAFTLRVKEVQ